MCEGPAHRHGGRYLRGARALEIGHPRSRGLDIVHPPVAEGLHRTATRALVAWSDSGHGLFVAVPAPVAAAPAHHALAYTASPAATSGTPEARRLTASRRFSLLACCSAWTSRSSSPRMSTRRLPVTPLPQEQRGTPCVGPSRPVRTLGAAPDLDGLLAHHSQHLFPAVGAPGTRPQTHALIPLPGPRRPGLRPLGPIERPQKPK